MGPTSSEREGSIHSLSATYPGNIHDPTVFLTTVMHDPIHSKELAMLNNARLQAIDERTRIIMDLSIGTQKALATGFNEVKKHITTAADNMLPTIFVIVPKEPEPTDMEEIREEALAAQKAYANGEKLKTGKKLLSFGLKCAEKAGKLYGTVTSVANDPVGTIMSKV